jgi:nucleotide-binding universal stress UspA family protein
MFSHILISTDGSLFSEKAVEMGLGLAKSLSARVTILTASLPFHVLTMDTMSLSDTKENYSADAEKRANAMFKLGLDRANGLGVAADSKHVFHDHPYEAIINAAAQGGCDLIVMASHGRRGIAGLLLGSETTKVLTHSKVPVLVCR